MSFKKLNWLQKGDIEITSGFHGQTWQNGQAQDFQSKPLFAPEKCRVMRRSIDRSNPYNSWANIEILDTVGRVYFQVVHFEVEKPEGYIYQKGEAITGKDTSGNNHFHITLNINNVWRKILEYTKQDRNIKIVYKRFLGAGGWSTFDFEEWSFYDSTGIKTIQFKQEEKPKPKPKPKPPVQKTYQLKQQNGKTRFWRSEAIQQIINAGELKGNWQQYDQEFQRLNPIPTGGYSAGQIVKLPN